jgi:hypothetical protein
MAASSPSDLFSSTLTTLQASMQQFVSIAQQLLVATHNITAPPLYSPQYQSPFQSQVEFLLKEPNNQCYLQNRL